MKFRKSSFLSSPKMELLRPANNRNKTTTFKRSKSFRASVKIITKIRNHANLHVAPSYDLPPLGTDRNYCDDIREKINSIAIVPENVVPSRTNKFKTYVHLNGGGGDDDKAVENSESTIAKKADAKPQEMMRERDKTSVTLDSDVKNNAYENPTFFDSSIDSSMSSFFHENDLDQSDEVMEFKSLVKRSLNLEQVVKKPPPENCLTVMIDNGQLINTSPRFSQVVKEYQDKYMADKKENMSNGFCNNRQNVIGPNVSYIEATSHKYSENLPKTTKPRTFDDITSLLGEAFVNGFNVKEKWSSRKNNNTTKEWNLATRRAAVKSRVRLTSASETKLNSLRGMDFLEGLGKKKQQQQQHDQQQQLQQQSDHRCNSLPSIQVNPFVAQTSLDIHSHGIRDDEKLCTFPYYLPPRR